MGLSNGSCAQCAAERATGARPDQNPKSAYGVKKPPLHLIPQAALVHESLAMAEGARKYGAYNWRDQPVAATVYVSAAMRHLAQWLDGEDEDPQSGVHHLAHARACLGILFDCLELGSLIDDRPTPGPAAETIRRLTRE